MLRELLVANEHRAGIFAEWRGMQSGAPETRCCCTSSRRARRPLRSSPAGFASRPWRCVSTSTGCPKKGLVAFDDERCRVGRPRRIWRLAPRAQAVFPDAHSDLAVELIDAMESAYGDEGLDRLVATRTRAQLKRYREALPPRDASDRETRCSARQASAR